MQKWNGTLLRKYDDVVDGNASVGTTVVVRNTVGNTIAVVYDVDDINSVQKNNPFVTDDFGRYSFFAPNGKYTIEFGDGSDNIEIVLVDNVNHQGLSGRNPADGSAHNANDVADNNGDTIQDYLSGHRSDNSSYITTEQSTNYTMTQNRHIFGEEYLWGAHKRIIDDNNATYIEFLYSGDSTTVGVNSPTWTPSVLGEYYATQMGLAYHAHINKGHSGDSAVDWSSTWVDADIASNPNARVYIARWGINDGSEHGNVATYIAAMESGLAKLRAWKSVSNLTILVMAPSATWDDANNRGTDWFESAIPELRKICRKYQACFFDTYSIWQDAKQGLGLWLDNASGGAVHPDKALNHQIMYKVMNLLLAPIQRSGLRTNSFINVDPRMSAITPTTTPVSYPTGQSWWTCTAASGFPASGKLIVKRIVNKVIQELHITGEDDGTLDTEKTSILVRVGDATQGVWGKWYNLAVNASLVNSWVTSASRVAKYVHRYDGSVAVQGAITGGANDTIAFSLPTAMAPAWNQSFALVQDSGLICMATVTSGGAVYVKYDGVGVVNLAGMCWQAGN